jgi:two-component SAPR family response regulator
MDRNWRIELFGGITVFKDGLTITEVDISRTATRDLLALLVLGKGRWMDVDTLAARIWPDAQPWHAKKSLFAAGSRLRQALGDTNREVVVGRGGLYRLNSDRVSTDVEDFDRLARVVTFAGGIDDGIEKALVEIEKIYKGDLLGRGELCRNRLLLGYNREYRTRMIGVMEVAAGLYLEKGDLSSQIKARWYVENIGRLQSQGEINALATRQQGTGTPSLKRSRGAREIMLG